MTYHLDPDSESLPISFSLLRELQLHNRCIEGPCHNRTVGLTTARLEPFIW